MQHNQQLLVCLSQSADSVFCTYFFQIKICNVTSYLVTVVLHQLSLPLSFHVVCVCESVHA